MKFDVVVGNPPYQESDGGAQASATPVYHKFVELSEGITKRYVSLIFPARWYVGGKGLNDFRDKMLDDVHIKIIYDFLTPEDVFPDTNIRGGLTVYIWDKGFDNTEDGARVISIENGNEISDVNRSLRVEGLNIFIRDNQALDILEKIPFKKHNLSEIASSRKPFGFGGSFVKSPEFKVDSKEMNNPIKIYGKGIVGYVEREQIRMHTDWIDNYKVFTARSNNIGTELNDDNLNTIIGHPKEIVTETYLVLGGDLNLNPVSANNLSSYLQTKFVRYLISLAKSSQDAARNTYRFVPMQNFTSASDINWSKSITEIDYCLYAKYDLSSEKIQFIEKKVKPMN